MSADPQPNPQEEPERLDATTDEAIAACDGDMRSTIRALILANEFLEAELTANTSKGYKRGYAHGGLRHTQGRVIMAALDVHDWTSRVRQRS